MPFYLLLIGYFTLIWKLTAAILFYNFFLSLQVRNLNLIFRNQILPKNIRKCTSAGWPHCPTFSHFSASIKNVLLLDTWKCLQCCTSHGSMSYALLFTLPTDHLIQDGIIPQFKIIILSWIDNPMQQTQVGIPTWIKWSVGRVLNARKSVAALHLF